MQTLLLIFGVASGFCMFIGVPWATAKVIYDCGFEPGDVVMMPIAGALTLAGGALIVGCFGALIG